MIDPITITTFCHVFQLETPAHDEHGGQEGVGPGHRKDVRIRKNGREICLPNVSRV
jgi:hypothetical protein